MATVKFQGKLEKTIYNRIKKLVKATRRDICANPGKRYDSEYHSAFDQLEKDNPGLIKREWDETGMCYYSI